MHWNEWFVTVFGEMIILIFWAMFDSFQCEFVVFCVRVLFVKINILFKSDSVRNKIRSYFWIKSVLYCLNDTLCRLIFDGHKIWDFELGLGHLIFELPLFCLFSLFVLWSVSNAFYFGVSELWIWIWFALLFPLPMSIKSMVWIDFALFDCFVFEVRPMQRIWMYALQTDLKLSKKWKDCVFGTVFFLK